MSPGCARCYMFRDQARFGRDGADIHRSGDGTFYRPLVWQRQANAGQRTGPDRLVFTCSWSDFFLPQADAWRVEAWAVIRRCPDLLFQIPTKRPELIAGRLPDYWDEIRRRVWLGASVETPALARPRLDALLEVEPRPGVLWVSAEPLLSELDLTPWLPSLDWVVIGGESGPQARRCDVDWIRSLLGQCGRHDVPAFVKQIGSNACWSGMSSVADRERAEAALDRGQMAAVSDLVPGVVYGGALPTNHAKGGEPSEWPPDLRVRRWPAGVLPRPGKARR